MKVFSVVYGKLEKLGHYFIKFYVKINILCKNNCLVHVKGYPLYSTWLRWRLRPVNLLRSQPGHLLDVGSRTSH